MTDDHLVDRFMRAVYEEGEQTRGWADAAQIMPHLGLDPQDLPTEDDHLYMSVAQHCEERGYIEKRADMYRAVGITDTGKRYVVFRGL
jgi:hypothetical protein